MALITPKVPHTELQLSKLIQQGLALHLEGELSKARQFYEQVLEFQPNHFDALQLLGTLAGQTKDFQKALELLSKALVINPHHILSHYNLGKALQELQRYREALISYDRAIAINPNYAEAHSNRGSVLHELKRFEEALISYKKAYTINPELSALNHHNIGLSLQELKRYDEAIAGYQKAIAINPDYTEAHWNLSLVQLLLGNFNEGWLEYEWRWKNKEVNLFAGIRNFDQPLWLGKEPLKDKTILLYAEQGLGDTIQFCRYVPLVSALGAKVILEVHPSLVPLLYDLDGVSQIIAKDSKLPEFDYQCPLLSLPLAFKTTLETIPSSPSYITSNQNKVAIWQAQLGEKTKPRIGLVWSGSTTHKNDHNRSLTLARLLPYLSPSYEYISLQKEVRDIDQELLNKCEIIKQFGDQLQDFTDTAALCGLMDLVISVDSSVAHLAAAMGISTWVLLPYNPDWRWLLNRDDSPWYHSVKLYRQPLVDDWNSVLEKTQADLMVSNIVTSCFLNLVGK